MRYQLRKEPLASWRESDGHSYAWLARKIGIKPRSLAHKLCGRSGVSLHVALSIEKEIGVPVAELVEAVQ